MAEGPVLIGVEGIVEGRAVTVAPGGLDVGRSPANQIVLEDDDVSRFHARILFDNGSLWVRDAGSRNGVFVNGKRVSDHKALKVGDRVRFGSCTFEVRWAEADTAETAGQGGTAAPERTEVREPIATAAAEATAPGTPPPAPRKRWFWPFTKGDSR